VAWSTQSSLSSLRPVAAMEAMMQVASTWMKAAGGLDPLENEWNL